MQRIIPTMVKSSWTAQAINEWAKQKSLIVTDCLKDDNEITLSATDESEPIFTFQQIANTGKFVMLAEV